MRGKRTVDDSKIAHHSGPGLLDRLARAIPLLAIAIAALSLLAACGMSMPAPIPAAELATTGPTVAGLFTVSYQSDDTPVPVNTLHAWTLHITDSAGRPVSNATVSVSGDMPAHGHGMPTRPQVTPGPAEGDYRVEGMKFQMPGEWMVTVTVTDTAGADHADFMLELK